MCTNAPKHLASCYTSDNRNCTLHGLWGLQSWEAWETIVKPSAKWKRVFRKHFSLCLAPGHSCPGCIQHTEIPRGGSRLLCRQNQRRGETIAALLGHKRGRSAQRRAVVREEKAIIAVGERYKGSFIPSAAQSIVSTELFSAQNLRSRNWTLCPDLKIVFHWRVYWVLVLPAGKSQAGHFPAQTPVHLSTCTWVLPSQSVSLTINRC